MRSWENFKKREINWLSTKQPVKKKLSDIEKGRDGKPKIFSFWP
jgi:hypothetical protein